MTSPEIELMVNSISMINLLISAVVLFVLGNRIYSRQEKSFIEVSFSFSLFIASIASLEASFFRLFYVFFDSGILVQTWYLASYLYFSLMSVALTGLFSVALGIYRGRRFYQYGWVTLIALIPITIAYWFLPDAISVTTNLADTELTVIGLALVYGVLGLQIILNFTAYFTVYRVTNNKGALYMAIGMISIAVSAAIGGFTDIFGEYGRLFDFLAYLGILIGLIIIYKGFGRQQ